MADTVRTFIAIELPEPVRERLAGLQAKLRDTCNRVRWVRPDRMHLTLVFLGGVPVDMLETLEAEVRAAIIGCGPLRLEVGGAGQFPPHGKPNVVWAAMEEPTGGLARLQGAIADATGAFAEKVDKRPYAPHITLGRVHERKGLQRLSAAIDVLARERGPAFEAREVVVMKSDLAPEGPVYTPLARLPFSG